MLKNGFIVMPAYNAGKAIEKVFACIPEETSGLIPLELLKGFRGAIPFLRRILSKD